MRGIQTTYAGHTFRSRLEAKWAAFFDVVGIHWEYEPLDMDGWIPDFMLMGELPILVDIKPVQHHTEFRRRATELDSSVTFETCPETSMCVILGLTPLLRWASPQGAPACGLMSPDDLVSMWGASSLTTCGACGAAGLVMVGSSTKIIPCGHLAASGTFPSHASIKYSWGMANGMTRWNG